MEKISLHFYFLTPEKKQSRKHFVRYYFFMFIFRIVKSTKVEKLLGHFSGFVDRVIMSLTFYSANLLLIFGEK
jgi:hypothetical protein